ncbi:hypothetical protein DFH09DRAFT_1075485 [Mycena vulgaris]|nr:hypothetical protein DFH09DRAFT_1075485 [Mycena vulgaris]
MLDSNSDWEVPPLPSDSPREHHPIAVAYMGHTGWTSTSAQSFMGQPFAHHSFPIKNSSEVSRWNGKPPQKISRPPPPTFSGHSVYPQLPISFGPIRDSLSSYESSPCPQPFSTISHAVPSTFVPSHDTFISSYSFSSPEAFDDITTSPFFCHDEDLSRSNIPNDEPGSGDFACAPPSDDNNPCRTSVSLDPYIPQDAVLPWESQVGEDLEDPYSLFYDGRSDPEASHFPIKLSVCGDGFSNSMPLEHGGMHSQCLWGNKRTAENIGMLFPIATPPSGHPPYCAGNKYGCARLPLSCDNDGVGTPRLDRVLDSISISNCPKVSKCALPGGSTRKMESRITRNSTSGGRAESKPCKRRAKRKPSPVQYKVTFTDPLTASETPANSLRHLPNEIVWTSSADAPGAESMGTETNSCHYGLPSPFTRRPVATQDHQFF